jgi:hypothetical protein
MESGFYEVVFRQITRGGTHEEGAAIGDFTIYGGELGYISGGLKSQLGQHPTLEEIFRRFDNSPYYFIRKKN